jgi:hypothetical protein
MLTYGFNHAGAVASFRKAQQLDPACAMCWWGEAAALGPNINAPMDDRDRDAALAALDRAVALKDKASPMERALIEALATRYSRDERLIAPNWTAPMRPPCWMSPDVSRKTMTWLSWRPKR